VRLVSNTRQPDRGQKVGHVVVACSGAGHGSSVGGSVVRRGCSGAATEVGSSVAEDEGCGSCVL
jgi:hypothetical protein